MLKNFFLFLLIFNYSFAIRDYMIKPSIRLSKLSFKTVNNYPEKLNSNINSDEYNIFKYSKHFRVIYGKNYEHNQTVINLANNILNIADSVWNKEIEDFGFRNPRHSDEFYIDIYIGNTKAYNKSEQKYMTIDDNYAGFATSYTNLTPYFIINPKININVLKVTIAHEFFHTIQYAYGVDLVSNEIWSSNIWFLEASAVMIEDEVYDDINDYINYLNFYLPYTNYSIDSYNGLIEYGKVLFAKFLKNKFGINFIKNIFENYKKNETILDDIINELKFYNEDFDNIIIDYASCLANLHICFKDGDKFPNITTYMLGTEKEVGYYGIVFYSSGSNNYLISSNPFYLQSNFSGEQNILENINDKGLIFISKKRNLKTNFLIYNNYNGFILQKGWNLISNIFNENLDFENFDVKIIWVYRNGKYCAYSKDNNLSNEIKRLNYECNDNFLYPGEGAWIYVDNEKNLSIKKYYLIKFNGFKKGIRGFSSVIDTNDIDENMTVWYYKDGNWSCFSNKVLNYPKLNKLIPGNGYFIFK